MRGKGGGPDISPQSWDQDGDRSETTNAERGANASGGREVGGKVPPWVREGRGDGEESSLGSWLRRQREMRGIELRQIADRTKISLRYLKAMEQDRFDLLPAAVFAKGFLREYAKYVGLNPDEVVNFFLSAHAAEGERAEGEVEELRRGGGGSSPWTWGVAVALAAVLALALVAYLAFYAESRRGGRPAVPASIAPPPQTELPPAAPPEPAPAAAQAPEAAPAAPLQVTLDFTQECWVEVVVDGRQRISELHVQGESLQLAAQTTVLLANIGNPAGVEIQVNGVPLPLTGPPGRPVRDLTIDLETASRLRSRAPR